MCDVTTTGPAAIPCRRDDDHDRGHIWHGTDVADGRHDEGVTDE